MNAAQLLARLRPRAVEGVIHPGDWPESTGKTRVLIENPDRADLWAHADLLRGAGYDVALCHGPSRPSERASWFHRRQGVTGDPELPQPDERTFCALLTDGRCSLVDGADVVVSTTELTEGREILAALGSRAAIRLVVEGPHASLERDRDVTGAATTIEFPVTGERLLAAVEDALAAPATPTSGSPAS